MLKKETKASSFRQALCALIIAAACCSTVCAKEVSSENIEPKFNCISANEASDLMLRALGTHAAFKALAPILSDDLQIFTGQLASGQGIEKKSVKDKKAWLISYLQEAKSYYPRPSTDSWKISYSYWLKGVSGNAQPDPVNKFPKKQCVFEFYIEDPGTVCKDGQRLSVNLTARKDDDSVVAIDVVHLSPLPCRPQTSK